MKKLIVTLLVFVFAAGCSGATPSEYTIVEQKVNIGGKSTARIYTEDVSEKNIEAIVTDLRMNDFFGSGSIHVWIHEPPNEELPDFGKLVAIAKYAHTEKGKEQVGVEETGKVYIEFE